MFAALLNFRGERLTKVHHALEQPASAGKRPWTKLPIACAAGLVTIGLSGCFKVSPDVGALRDSVIKAAHAEREERIEIGVGPLTLSLARAGLAFVDLEPEARTALHVVRSAEVGVYKLCGGHPQRNHAAMLSAADKTMAVRGWDRVVGVMNPREMVAIYLPAKAHSTRNVKVCLLVMNGEELVVASVRSNWEALMEMAGRLADRHHVDLSPLRLSAARTRNGI